jgi:hypothetical protein
MLQDEGERIHQLPLFQILNPQESNYIPNLRTRTQHLLVDWKGTGAAMGYSLYSNVTFLNQHPTFPFNSCHLLFALGGDSSDNGSQSLPRWVVILCGLWWHRFPIGFLVPVHVIVYMSRIVIFNTAPYTNITFHAIPKFLLSSLSIYSK